MQIITEAAPNICNTGGTNSFQAPKATADLKKWVFVETDLKAFAGKQFKIRFRFNSGTGSQNNFPGWFVDELKFYGIK